MLVSLRADAARTKTEKKKVSYVRDVSKLENIPEDVRADLEKVAQKYVFRANDYYLSLIDWKDPADPIRQLVIPRIEELDDWGRLDASNEAAVTVSKGVQHKYRDTALLLCNEVCGSYCRYCFRKRLFMDENDEVSLDVSEGLEYIAAHPEITDVLLTGGDPMLMATRRIREIISRLREIPHVGIIRIGSKMPAFNPWRVLDDPDLLETFATYSTPEKRIYVMAHFDHPRELTEPALEGIAALLRAGVKVVNQCPLIKGVNDDPAALNEMWRKLSFIGAPQYYLFQGRPTAGNAPFEVPIARGFQIFEQAKLGLSGLAKRMRFAMSHDSGKIEILGMDERHFYMRFHRALDPADEGRFLVFERDDEASWLDGLRPVSDLGNPRAKAVKKNGAAAQLRV